MCEMCGQSMSEATGCVEHKVHLMTGEVITSPKHDTEGSLGVGINFNNGNCPDCGVEPDEYHHPMCDWSQTPEDTRAHNQVLSAVHHFEEL